MNKKTKFLIGLGSSVALLATPLAACGGSQATPDEAPAQVEQAEETEEHEEKAEKEEEEAEKAEKEEEAEKAEAEASCGEGSCGDDGEASCGEGSCGE